MDAGKNEGAVRQHNHYYYTKEGCKRNTLEKADRSEEVWTTANSRRVMMQDEGKVGSESDGKQQQQHHNNRLGSDHSIFKEKAVSEKGMTDIHQSKMRRAGSHRMLLVRSHNNYYQYNYNYYQSPLRGVNQRSSIADVSTKFGEPNQRVGPKAKVQDTHCESWLSLFKTRSNLVSQREGWRDTEGHNMGNYSSVRKGTTTTKVDHHNYHIKLIENSGTAYVGGAN